MPRETSLPGNKNTDLLKWRVDGHGNRQVDISGTLGELHRSRDDILNNRWAANSVEFRVKQAILRKKVNPL